MTADQGPRQQAPQQRQAAFEAGRRWASRASFIALQRARRYAKDPDLARRFSRDENMRCDLALWAGYRPSLTYASAFLRGVLESPRDRTSLRGG